MQDIQSLGQGGFPKVTPAEVRRFESVARIDDPEAFAAELDALFQEKLTVAGRPVVDSPGMVGVLADKARELRAGTRWEPSATDLQRGRAELLRMFDQPRNLPVREFARLAHKSRQQIYKDLAARPRRLLALSLGSRGQRLPDWQLDPLGLRLTRAVLKATPEVDAWTLYRALAEPLGGLDGRSPVEAVNPGNLDRVARAVQDALGIHDGMAA